MESHRTFWRNTSSWNILEGLRNQGIFSNDDVIMELAGMFWNIMEHHGMSWNIMERHRTFWKDDVTVDSSGTFYGN